MIFARSGAFITIIDPKTAKQIELSRAESKDLARFLLVELNVVEFILQDGRKGSEIDQKFVAMVNSRVQVGKNN